MDAVEGSGPLASARSEIETLPSIGHRVALHPASSSYARLLAGPIPVLLIGAIVAIGQALSHAWTSLDANLYWQASARLDNLYADGWTSAYNYSNPPIIAQLWAPLHILPFEVVQAVWTVVLFGCLWYATRGWALVVLGIGAVGIALGLPFLSAPLGMILLGNVGMLLTAGVVATIRWPAAAAVPALTKVGPGVALAWHLFRGDRQALVRGVALMTLVFAISFVVNPASWIEWLNWIVRNYASNPLRELAVPFVVRAPIGIGIIAIAARTNRPWLVPIGAGLCIPADYGFSFVTVWVGAFGLLGQRGATPSS
jgi:Glycosyltransferase family 87